MAKLTKNQVLTTLDGKSIMGVFSIDISKGITVKYPETATDFEEYLSQFKVNEAGS